MDINKIIADMTLEEKASFVSGSEFWFSQPVERLGVPAIMLSDGPHGLRKQDRAGDHLGINDSIKAVCFPAACASSCSFDTEMMGELGAEVGESCQHEEVAVNLGPATNIKRSPLCGRNFEYISEDPYLAGKMAAALINGVQSRNIGTSLKHFAANNQEHRRMTSDSVIDERTLREIYLTPFEIAVKESQPWTVMASYNLLNGTQVVENKWLLTDVLRNEWGFEGLVVTDWGASRDRVKGLKAGVDLEMPSSGNYNDQGIIDAVNDGTLSMDELDACVRRILELVDKYESNKKPETPWDMEHQHDKAAGYAENSAVLLKNEAKACGNPILPLDKDARVVFIGGFADKPRYQGGGSSHVNSWKVESAMEAAADLGISVEYAKGYEGDGAGEPDEAVISEAVECARNADAAVVFAGLPESFESEGYDRSHMEMPSAHNKLIEAVAGACDNVVVVLHHGAPVEMPWADLPQVKGILDMYLGGQAVGRATVRLLYGMANPSGKLAESIPYHLSDNPAYLYFKGEGDRVEYREGVFVGYRYYDKKNMPVRYPFGYGLSYTTFEYSNLRVDKAQARDGETVKVSVDVTNTGKVAGKEIVQIYVGRKSASDIIRPVRELKGFAKLALEPGETGTAEFELGERAFAYWNTDIHDWYAESGEYTVEAASSIASIEASCVVTYNNSKRLPKVWTDNSTMRDLMTDPKASVLMKDLMAKFNEAAPFGENSDSGNEAISEDMTSSMIGNMPLRSIVSFMQGFMTKDEMDAFVDRLNAQENSEE